MRYLLDDNVVSELRKGPRTAPKVRSWFDQQTDVDLALSVLTIGEIRAGITRLAIRDPEQAEHLHRWLQRMQRRFFDRILPVTDLIADRWGRLSPAQPLPVIDGLLAATALEHDLTIVTRNVADFERSGVPVLNPFED